ncbi:hypothetical protein TNCV_588901 [Trichonephila clavipes]|nr:hypothetical protein TNCV_588901 [Trichonephila clavipes]
MKSVFSVATKRCKHAAIRSSMESNRFWMSSCGREFHIACMRSKSVDRCALTSFSVVYCQFFELLGARRSIVSKLSSLWNSSAAHKLLLRDRKILLLKGR